MSKTERLFSREFILINLIFFAASITTAIFFQFHRYLDFLKIHEEWSGFIIAADAIPAIVLQPILGALLNNKTTKKCMLTGILIMVIAMLSYRLASTVPTLVAVRILQGTGFACLVSAMMVLVVSYIPLNKSGMAFGVISTVRLIPYAFVPPIMGMYFAAPQDFIKAVIYCIIPMMLSLLLAATVETPHIMDNRTSQYPSIKINVIIKNFKNLSVTAVLLLNLLLYSGYTTVFFFFEGFSRKSGNTNPGMFFAVATAMMFAVRVFGSKLFDSINKAYLTFFCMLGLTICYAALPFSSSYSVFYILAFFTGLAWGTVMPVAYALMFEVSDPQLRGLNLNLSLVMMQGGFFIGPFLGGIVHGWWGYGMLFYFCAFISLLSAMLARIVIYHTNKAFL